MEDPVGMASFLILALVIYTIYSMKKPQTRGRLWADLIANLAVVILCLVILTVGGIVFWYQALIIIMLIANTLGIIANIGLLLLPK